MATGPMAPGGGMVAMVGMEVAAMDMLVVATVVTGGVEAVAGMEAAVTTVTVEVVTEVAVAEVAVTAAVTVKG